ncbi:MAG: integrase [Arenicella sp.]|jgi:integrase
MSLRSRPVKRIKALYKVGSGQAQIVEKPSQLSNILWRASQGQFGRRNVAITMMLFGSGMRIGEVGQLRVKDILYKNGEIKPALKLPAKFTKTNKSRVVYIIAKQQRSALELWLKQRVKEKILCSFSDDYLGPNPESPLFLSKKKEWRKFAYNVKKYPATDDKGREIIKETLVCSSLENMIRGIIKGAGIEGGSSHTGRRTLATWLDRKGCDLEAIQDVLNHESPDMTLVYIEPWMSRIEKASGNILKGVKVPDVLK